MTPAAATAIPTAARSARSRSPDCGRVLRSRLTTTGRSGQNGADLRWHRIGEDDDRTLVVAAQAGDERALNELLRRHYDRVHAVCRRIAGGSRDADDATQEAMISIVRGLPRFDGRAAFSTWIYRIATNAALDELRRRRRRPQLHAVADDDLPHDIVDDTAAARVDAIAERMTIDKALDELAEDFRIAVVLRDVADLDYAEISTVLEVPVGTVKSRIARGRGQLADRLGNRSRPSRRPSGEPPDPPADPAP